MAAYIVALRNTLGKTFKNGANAVVVTAASETIAKQMAAAQFDGDGNAWTEDDAEVTAVAAAADWAGWTFRVTILSDTPKEFEVIADATTNTMDEVGAALVTALNADADIAGAAYDSTTQTLTVAETTDGLGDQLLQVEVIPPGGFSSIAGLLGTITDGGASGDALSVVLPADAAVVPAVAAAVAMT